LDNRPTTEQLTIWGFVDVLYDRIYRRDVLSSAYQIARANKGAAGVDGVTFDDIESSSGGVEGFVDEIHESLKARAYRPMAVRRVWIPKPDGRKRPLGIPTIRDRVVQTAALLIIEPIFEADFMDCSYGFRPKRSAHDALSEVRKHLKKHLRRRSQRPFRPPRGRSFYQHFKKLGLIYL
jgi:RNA-directed DNA polymerase